MRISGFIVVVGFLLVLRAGAQVRDHAPNSFDVVEKSIPELQAAMTAGRVTSRQLVEAYLARIAAYDKQGPALNAIVSLR